MRATTKIQTRQQISGRRGEARIEDGFPEHWILRKLLDDFGLDFSIEVFNRADSVVKGAAMTTGQFLYAQVKTVARASDDFVDRRGTQVLRVRGIEVPLLNTVVAMGSAVPVLLIHVNRKTRKMYWVCLTDYIDKILRADNPKYHLQKTVTIYIAPENELSTSASSFWLIEALSQRAKLYSVFAQCDAVSQLAERALERWTSSDAISLPDGLSEETLRKDPILDTIRILLAAIQGTDVWTPTEIGHAQLGNVPELSAAVHALAHGIEALMGERKDYNRIMRDQPGLPKGPTGRGLFSAETSSTARVATFLSNLAVGFKRLEHLGTSYEVNQRWMGLPNIGGS